MGRYSHRVQMIEDVFGNAVVQNALSVDDFMLLRVEGGGVVLEMLNQCSGLRPLIEDLGLALEDAAAAVHGSHLWDIGLLWLVGKGAGIAASTLWRLGT